MALHYDYPLRENANRPVREPGNGVIVDETTAICPVCHDVDCTVHPEEPPTQFERDTAEWAAMKAVVLAARAVLDAVDASDPLPKRVRMAVSDLSDTVANYDAKTCPF